MTAPLLTLIAALDTRQAIGRAGQLPWQLPDDLKRFKALTNGKPVVMGRKTAESLGRCLPWRKNIVITRSGQAPFPGMHPVASLEQALAEAGTAEEVMVIGGGEIYAMALPLAGRLRLTWVDTTVEDADAFFPAFSDEEWMEVGRDFHPRDSKHALDFCFVDYLRRGE